MSSRVGCRFDTNPQDDITSDSESDEMVNEMVIVGSLVYDDPNEEEDPFEGEEDPFEDELEQEFMEEIVTNNHFDLFGDGDPIDIDIDEQQSEDGNYSIDEEANPTFTRRHRLNAEMMNIFDGFQSISNNNRRNRTTITASSTLDEDTVCADYCSSPFDQKTLSDNYPSDDLIVFLSTQDFYLFHPSNLGQPILHIPTILASHTSQFHHSRGSSSIYHNSSVAWELDRLSILHWIPQISSVVIGSQAGFAIIVHLLRQPQNEGMSVVVEAQVLVLPRSDARVGPLAGISCRRISDDFHQLFLLYLDGSTRVYNIYQRLDL